MSRDEVPAEVRTLAKAEARSWFDTHDGEVFETMVDAFCSVVMADRASRPAAPATDAEGERLPCDVLLPPRTTIKKGCSIMTLLAGIRSRATWPEEQAVFARSAPAPHAVEETARPSVPPVAEAREEMIRENERDRLLQKAHDQACDTGGAYPTKARAWLYSEAGAMLPAERQRLRAETEASR